ncbi:DUF4822 domain-containing protein [Comamonas piscis]|uniref:DUF4822 domain-containing protein n=1 Tax=Comamonas piscis TaxID=1562974 RepID=A0A7G5EDU6_9BURK|nr:DUF4822 domain-containing protein [Comamonas piscis]QMV72171.1 DUF4822 domain-containing protein [Comamonas piscis]WSO34922.1 DUF4822 domain-containing protein [Comamonas piscis]
MSPLNPSLRPAALPLAAALLAPAYALASPACTGASPDAQVLAEKTWLTTAVYEGDDRSNNLVARYPGVVGISLWDACSNRYEYFDPATGRSRSQQGGAGWFFFTGDRQHQHTVSDNGSQLRRKMEVINPKEFTYSRQVPKDMREGQALVTIHVVHTPYTGTFQVKPSAGIGPK